jgi:hypothetical protein
MAELQRRAESAVRRPLPIEPVFLFFVFCFFALDDHGGR